MGKMIYIKDIDESLKNLSRSVSSDLKGYKPVMTYNKVQKRDIPERYIGGFAAAAHVVKDRKEYALRIWTKKIEGIKDRAAAISDYLKQRSSSYFIAYNYISNGLKIAGNFEDVVLMDWIKGKTLYNFVDSNLKNPDKLKLLADKCLDMFKWMHANQMSHGDIQHDNVIVDDNLNLYFCDYDSVCIPKLEGKPLVTPGLPGYQHPLRFSQKDLKCSVKDDYFSEIVIYMGLLALSLDSKLWDHDDNNEPYFLLSEFDFKKIINGEECKTLNRLKNLKGDADVVKKVNEMVDLLVENLKCDSLSKIKPIPETQVEVVAVNDDDGDEDIVIGPPPDGNKGGTSGSGGGEIPPPPPPPDPSSKEGFKCPECGSYTKSQFMCSNCGAKITIKNFPF